MFLIINILIIFIYIILTIKKILKKYFNLNIFLIYNLDRLKFAHTQ